MGGGRSENYENNYFIFEEKALNTFDENLAEKYQKHSKLMHVIKLKTLSLESILDSYLPKNTEIDFLSIDCEGRDIDVLESNNFEKYRPKYIIIEILENEKEALKFLNANGYKSCYQAFNSVFFKKIK